MNKILVISRKHRDDDNPIYNFFFKAISKVKEIIFIDYFDEYSLKGKNNFENHIKEILKKERVREIFFIFVSGDVTLDLKFICEISQNRAVYMTFWDLEQHFEIIDRYYAQCADLVFLPSNKEFEEVFKLYDIKAKWTFSLFDKDKYVLDLKRDIDVSFIGDLNKGNRKEYLEFLKQNGINIEVFGAGSKNGKVSFKKMVEILNRSKISLNFSDIFENSQHSYYKKINNRIKQTKGRVVEVCMSGAFLITEPSNSLNDLLDINSIDTSASKEELLEKVKFYLENDSLREKKAKKAQIEVIEKYDSLLLSNYLNEKPSNKYVYVDKEFKKIYGTFRWFYFLEFLVRKKFENSFEELKEVCKNGLYLKESFLYFKYFLKDFIKYLKIKKKIKRRVKKTIKNSNEIVLYPDGNLSRTFADIFEIDYKFIIDDNGAKRLKDVQNEIILISNYIYADVLEKKLQNKNYINPFKNLSKKEWDLFFKFKNKMFDIYSNFNKIGR